MATCYSKRKEWKALILQLERRTASSNLRAIRAQRRIAFRERRESALRELGLQGLRGKRGVAWLPIGVLEVLAAVCWGFMVSMVNDDSDLLIS